MNNLTVQPYQPRHWKHVALMLKTWPFKPMAQYSGCCQSKLLAFTRERVRRALESDAGNGCVAFNNSQAAGFASLRPLPWDSQQLGILAARIDHLLAEGSYEEQLQIKKRLVETILWEAFERGFRHLSVRVDASDFSSLHALESTGFITVDTIITFVMDFARQQPSQPQHDFKIRLATPADSDKVAALAKTAFLYDRFHADPAIDRERADSLHESWLRNSCGGRSADAVVMAESDDELLGFAACMVQRDTPGRLGRKAGTMLIAASAEHARQRGVAHATMMAATEWLRQQGCEIVDGGTQVRNVPSARLFRRCGYSYVGASISLRRIFDARQASVFRSHLPVATIDGSGRRRQLPTTK
jgi:ribosomal protein S18 acetylase RimI-like enzyme